MTGGELQAWVNMMTKAGVSIADGMKHDDLAKAMEELSDEEKKKVIGDVKGIASYIQGVAQILTTLHGE
jgi:hypothetical protein